MSFEQKLNELAVKAASQRAMLLTEEAMKTAIILRMLGILEYDVHDASEIVPEFTADFGNKKGEKVDYAIKIGGQVVVLIECKGPNAPLDPKHNAQLFRYFSVTDAKFAILTNGFDWDFYTDLDEPNKMDKLPFLSFALTEMDTASIAEFSRFRKSAFDVAAILGTAKQLKYISALKARIRTEVESPSEEMVMLLGKGISDRSFTPAVKQYFAGLVKRSFGEVIRDRINARLKNAMLAPTESADDELGESDGIETTEDEWDGFRIATAISARILDPSRVFIRDTKSYCGVLIDNNNRKPLVRLYFNSSTTRYLGLFDAESEEKVLIGSPTDIYKYADRIVATAQKYVAI
jgi:predicted type IV restriction endonuclease